MEFEGVGALKVHSMIFRVRAPLLGHLHLPHRQHTNHRRASYRTERLRKGRHITTDYVRQAIITGERQKHPLPTADGLAGHPDHHEEIQIVFIVLNVLYIRPLL
jgi:hypothetical protein